MSSINIETNINSILEPVIFQVIGSNPATVRDSLLKAGVKNNPKAGVQLAASVLFASAVNKATVETFISNPNLAEARTVLNQAFFLNNRLNMTALTLMGHCLLTSKQADKIDFALAFRKKMGQRDIWDGNLESGSLGEKQKQILKEKAKAVKKDEAMLLGQGYWKYVGADNEPMSSAEMNFWKISTQAPRQAEAAGHAQRPSTSSSSSSSKRLAESSSSAQRTASPSVQALGGPDLQYTTNEQAAGTLPGHLVAYYKKVNGGTDQDVFRSVDKYGLEGWIMRYQAAYDRDPGGNAVPLASRVS